nr:polymorphic toxin type 34 domain-containing protein [Escherichia coli]
MSGNIGANPGDISAKDAKSTQKAWNCRHSRQSNDKKR